MQAEEDKLYSQFENPRLANPFCLRAQIEF